MTTFTSARLLVSFVAIIGSASHLEAQIANRLASSDSAQGFVDDDSARPHLDAEGRYVVFQSDATNLVNGDTNGQRDVFLKDFGTGLTFLISRGDGGAFGPIPGNGPSSEPRISSTGRYVVFGSRASNLVLNDHNGMMSDVFVFDRMLGTMTMASRNHLGIAGNGSSTWGSISDDGRYVAFQSEASGLIVGGENNGVADVFIRDLITGIVTLCSHNGAGQSGNGPSRSPRMSRDGQFVVFESNASDLVANDTNGRRDVFAYDRNSGTVVRCNLGPGAVQSNADSSVRDVSEFGGEVVYSSFATNLVAGDTNNRSDVFVSSLIGAWTERASVSSTGAEADNTSLDAHISADGRYVAFMTRASNLYPGASGTQVIAVRDRVLGTTERASESLLGGEPNGSCSFPAISDDGRYVAYMSSAPNLIFGKVIPIQDVVRADIIPPVIATTVTYGQGCPGSQGISVLDAAPGSRPWLGTTFRLAGSNAPQSSIGIVMFGFTNVHYQGIVLPAPMGAYGMPNCNLLTSIDLTQLVFTDPAGSYSASLGIPNGTSWRGVSVFAQTWLVDPPANALGAIVSNGLQFTIGG